MLLIVSCSKYKKTKKDNNNYIHKIIPYNSQSEDSISYELWYATAFLLPESEIPQVPQINEMEQILSEKLQSFKDSLLYSVKNGKIPLIQDNKGRNISPLIKDYIKSGDVNSYCKLSAYSPPTVSFYMAEIYNFTPAYTNTFYGLLKYSKRINPDENFNEYLLKFLRKEDQDLAIYSLIKSYKKGNIDEAKILAYYFREGLYFNKDIDVANVLDSIYENKLPLIESE
ncbi:hypothetical protein D0T84_21765 [Dysgonomonas sp. 521]|nr:hypothetical protein [Dysgonomonas sp. 521]